MEADFTSQPPDSTALRADKRDVEVGRETERERERESAGWLRKEKQLNI